MKEILFGGICKDNDEWVYGSLERLFPSERCLIIHYVNGIRHESEVYPETVSQYIGYEDIRHNKVYEGNKVFCEENGCTGVVKYEDGKYFIEWEIQEEHLRKDVNFWFKFRRMYVIGSIFDNSVNDAKFKHKGYTLVQGSECNFHYMIFAEDGHMVMHSSHEKLITEEKAKELIEGYILLADRLNDKEEW